MRVVVTEHKFPNQTLCYNVPTRKGRKRKSAFQKLRQTVGSNEKIIRANIRQACRRFSSRVKTVYTPRQIAMFKIGRVILAKIDVRSGYVFAGVTTLSIGAGLASRCPDSDKWDISNGRRALLSFREIGALEFDDGIFNPENGACDSLRIMTTPLFFSIMGDLSGAVWNEFRANLERTFGEHADLSATFEIERQKRADELHDKRIAFDMPGKRHQRTAASDLKKLFSLARLKAERIRQAVKPALKTPGWHLAAEIVTDMRKTKFPVPVLIALLTKELSSHPI